MVTRKGLVVLGLATSFVLSVVACAAPVPTLSKQKKAETEEPTLGEVDEDVAAPDLATCAKSVAKATPRPVYLVFMYDRSGSMRDDNKWQSCETATQAFFQSPASAGIHASLSFFPTSGSSASSCAPAAFAQPAVAMTTLPSATFQAALTANAPADGFSFGGGSGTPTEPALSGALEYAQQLATGTAKDGSVAIVLVTDGEPQGCNSAIPGVAQVAQTAAAAKIPTYVVGVGDLAALNAIAIAGGTKQAFAVDTTNPAKTQADFSKAVDTIRQSALACDYAIPAPPAGETFDRSKVNVQYTPAGAAPSAFSYNQECTGGKGWKYDDASKPKRILLCDSSCGQVKASGGGVQVLFGCTTKGDVVR